MDTFPRGSPSYCWKTWSWWKINAAIIWVDRVEVVLSITGSSLSFSCQWIYFLLVSRFFSVQKFYVCVFFFLLGKWLLIIVILRFAQFDSSGASELSCQTDLWCQQSGLAEHTLRSYRCKHFRSEIFRKINRMELNVNVILSLCLGMRKLRPVSFYHVKIKLKGTISIPFFLLRQTEVRVGHLYNLFSIHFLKLSLKFLIKHMFKSSPKFKSLSKTVKNSISVVREIPK